MKMKSRAFQVGLIWAITGVAVGILFYWLEIVILAGKAVVGILLCAILFVFFILVAWVIHQRSKTKPRKQKAWLWQVWLTVLLLAEFAVLPASIASEGTLSLDTLLAALIMYVPEIFVGWVVWAYLGEKRPQREF